MAILVTCSACGAKLRVQDEYLGKEALCPACKEPLILNGERVPNHEVFVSYSNKDKTVADAICAKLEEQKIRCWIAPRDIPAGHSWGDTIIKAIEDAQVMVLVYSGNSNLSPQVIREVERAVAKGLIIVPFRIEAAPMSREMEYFLSSSHWFDALTRPVENHLVKLAETVRMLLLKKSKGELPVPQPVQPQRKKGFPWVRATLSLTLLLLLFGAGFWAHRNRHTLIPRIVTNEFIQVIEHILSPSSETAFRPASDTSPDQDNIKVVVHTTVVERTVSSSDVGIMPIKEIKEEQTLASKTVVHHGTGRPVNLSAPYENSLGMKFVPVPGTKVLFSIWDTRMQDYRVFVTATGLNWHKEVIHEQGPTYPAVDVDWDDAKAFCMWLTLKERREGRIGEQQSFRLPTDEEWSVAVGLPAESGSTPKEKHGKIKGIYPWGNQWPPPYGAGNYNLYPSVDDFKWTSPVGSFVANRFGLYDMGGNVEQWCEDAYDDTRGLQVLRGASWENAGCDFLESSFRDPRMRYDWNVNIGFRVVLANEIVSKTPSFRANQIQTVSEKMLEPVTGQRWSNSLGMIFVPVPGTKVLLSIWITRVRDYRAFTNATGHLWKISDFEEITDRDKGTTVTIYRVRDKDDPSTTPLFKDGPNHPAISVSWDDANAFCDWLTSKERREGLLEAHHRYRLPTFEEWNAAVGLPTNFNIVKDTNSIQFLWGSQWPPPRGAGNFASSLGVDDFLYTSPVGSFHPNQYGFFDMAGNVDQWCQGLGKKNMFRGSSFMDDDPELVDISTYGWTSAGYSTSFRCVLEGGMPGKK